MAPYYPKKKRKEKNNIPLKFMRNGSQSEKQKIQFDLTLPLTTSLNFMWTNCPIAALSSNPAQTQLQKAS